MKLIQRIPVPGVTKNFDHLAADPNGNRLFSCAEWHGTVEVFDLKTGRLIHSINEQMVRPHSVLYREYLNRIYVVDATEEAGALRIYDGKSYSLIKSLNLPPDADWIAYDPAAKNLYVTANGDVSKRAYSTISIIDTDAARVVADIKVDGDVIEDLVLDTASSKIYVGNLRKAEVDVIDLNTRAVVASWPLTLGKSLAPLALDQRNHRLYVGCRTGQIVVFDTLTGKELQALPINQGADDLLFDAGSKRLYANCPGPKDGKWLWLG